MKPCPKTVKSALQLTALVFGLGACLPFTPTKVPESAIASCVSQAGFAEGTTINVDRAFRTDGMDARVRPSIDIDQAAARQINACLELSVTGHSAEYIPGRKRVVAPTQAALGGAYSQTTYTYSSAPASAQTAAPRAVSRPQATRSVQCAGGVFQGGTSYCIQN